MLTDIKHAFFSNLLRPAYDAKPLARTWNLHNGRKICVDRAVAEFFSVLAAGRCDLAALDPYAVRYGHREIPESRYHGMPIPRDSPDASLC
jgi:hypothetical protein